MRKIATSLVIVLALAVLSVGATYAVFSSTASYVGSTYATGILEIRVNGETAKTSSMDVQNAAPGTEYSGEFTVNNYGAPWFGGPSTLAAMELVISKANPTGDMDLFNALMVKVEANRGWATRMPVYEGKLKNLAQADLLGSRWTSLAAGDSEVVYYTVWLPTSAGDSLQGKSCTFDFAVEAFDPHR